jgi:hypothetical protein
MMDTTNLEGGKKQKHLVHNVNFYMTPKLILQSIVLVEFMEWSLMKVNGAKKCVVNIRSKIKHKMHNI